jgi:hypothetical protein
MVFELRWLDTQSAAAYICVRPDAMSRLVKSGRLPAPSYHLVPLRQRTGSPPAHAALSQNIIL